MALVVLWDRAQLCSLAMVKEQAVVLSLGCPQELAITMSFCALHSHLCFVLDISMSTSTTFKWREIEKKVSLLLLSVNASWDCLLLLRTEALLPEFGLSLALNSQLFYIFASHPFFFLNGKSPPEAVFSINYLP